MTSIVKWRRADQLGNTNIRHSSFLKRKDSHFKTLASKAQCSQYCRLSAEFHLQHTFLLTGAVVQGSLDLDLFIQNKRISVAFQSLMLPCKLLATVFEIKLHYPPGECGHHIM